MSKKMNTLRGTFHLPDEGNGDAFGNAQQLIQQALEAVPLNFTFEKGSNPTFVFQVSPQVQAPVKNVIEGDEFVNEKKTDIKAGRGAIIINDSNLKDVLFKLETTHTEESGEITALRDLIREFIDKLGEAGQENVDEVEVLTTQLDGLTTQATKPEPKKGLLSLSAKGLMDATKAVGNIVPGLIDSAEKIFDFVTGMGAGSGG